MITPELVSRVFAEPAPDEGDASFNAITDVNKNVADSKEAVAFIVACTAMVVRRWHEIIDTEDNDTKPLTPAELALLIGPAASLVVMGYRLGLAETEEAELAAIEKASQPECICGFARNPDLPRRSIVCPRCDGR